MIITVIVDNNHILFVKKSLNITTANQEINFSIMQDFVIRDM